MPLKSDVVFDRHDRVWLTSFALAALVRDAGDATERAALELWTARGWPFVVRRGNGDTTRIAIGLALPPALGKRRFGFVLPRSGIAAHAPPLAIDDVVVRFTGDTRYIVSSLARAANCARVALRVFGSTAWQAQTGLDYVRPESDVDVLTHVVDTSQLDAAVRLFENSTRRLRMRVDGEIVFPGGDAVAWREWAQPQADSTRVIAKHVARVALVSRRELIAQLRQRSCAA